MEVHMKIIGIILMMCSTWPLGALDKQKPYRLKAVACAVREAISEDKKPVYMSNTGEVNFRFVKDGIPGTNQKDVGVSAVFLYALDGKMVLIVHLRKDKTDGIVIEPMVDILHRGISGKWSPMDVAGGPNTGAVTSAYADRLDHWKMNTMTPFLVTHCKTDH
jgi:hypothetical protein